MNWQAMAETGTAMSGIAEPAIEARPETSLGGAADDWLCAWCLNRVAKDRDRFRYEGRDEFAFANPAGIWFRIITFSRTLGCEEAGKPILKDTWFPGHAWSFCVCDRCGEHLGWYYTGPQDFAGLITDRIVRAQCIRN